MRILQICSASSVGGGERHLADLTHALAKRGHTTFLAMRPGAPLRKLLPEIDAPNILETRMLNAADVLSSSHIATFAKKNKVDIVHAHVARDYTIAALAARLAGRPFVLTRHVLFPMKRLHRFVLGRVGAIIAPSTAVFNGVRSEGVLPADRVTLIHNGVDINVFAPQPSDQRATLNVGSIGHLGKLKGHDIFIRAAAIAAKQNPALKFIITGEDKNRSGQSRDALAGLIDGLGMQDRIKLAGWANDIRETLRETDIFVSAARSEPFGLSIAEAMASAIPVIATASEGASEIIIDGESGIVVPLQDPGSLAVAILKLAADEALRQRIGKGGRERIVEHFSLDQMVGGTESLYERVVKEHSRLRR